jgi:chromosome partitioning protein
VRVVSVLNYKGGVGKTTVTANLGAELAQRGRSVLLIDLDPQSSLTYSFYKPDEWNDLDAPTVMQWYDSFARTQTVKPLADFVVTPPRVDAVLERGRLDLIASDLGLIDVELDLAAVVGGTRFQLVHPDYLRAHRLLADALAAGEFRDYDVVLIDCPPSFGMVTRTAIVASEYILVPAKADHLSTQGITYLRGRLTKLVESYNAMAGPDPEAWINPVILGVVFTMVQYASSGMMAKLDNYMEQTRLQEIATFATTLRESKAVFADASDLGVPAVLARHVTDNVHYDLQQLTSEFIAKARI